MASLFRGKNEKFEKKDVLYLIAGVLVFSLLSFIGIADSSIWFDEAFSAYLIQFSFSEIWQYTGADVHPPFYYYLLKIWSSAFGTTELGLRSMSVFFGAIAVGFGYLISHKLFGRRAALYTLAILAVAPMVIRYSQEMRMYTTVAAITLGATYTLLNAVESKNKKLWALYGVLVSLGMWTHYFAAIVWLSHWAWRAVVTLRSAPKNKFVKTFFSREWISSHALAVGLFLPWLPYMIMQIGNVQINGFWIPPISPITITNFLTNTIFYLDQAAVTPWLTVLFLVLVITLFWLGVKAYKIMTRSQKVGYLLLSCMSFIPAGLLIITSLPPLQSTFIDRYLVPSSFAIGMLIAVTLAYIPKVIKNPFLHVAIVIITLGSFVIGTINLRDYGNFNKTTGTSSGAKQIVAQIQASSNTEQPIIADSPWVFYDTTFYSTPKNPVYFIDENTEYRYGSLEMLRTQDRNKIKDLAAFSQEYSVVWVVGRPGDSAKVTSPDEKWKLIKTLSQPDPTTGKPAYTAIQYSTR